MIGIIILNYNTWNETIQCIESIKKYHDMTNKKIYVVDNNSIKKMHNKQENFFKNNQDITLIFNVENKGYAAGNNVGMKYAIKDGCENFLICNSDILFRRNSIDVMNRFLSENSDTCIVAPEIYDKNNVFHSIHMLSKLTAIGKIKNMMLKTPFRLFFKKFEASFIRKKEIITPLKVFGVSGCCFMLSSRIIDILYPLDERTFLYEEEYIIGAIIERTEYDIFILPEIGVMHAQGISTGGMNFFSYKCLVNSEQLYLNKYINSSNRECLLIYIIRSFIFLIKSFKNEEYRSNIKVYFRETISYRRRLLK